MTQSELEYEDNERNGRMKQQGLQQPWWKASLGSCWDPLAAPMGSIMHPAAQRLPRRAGRRCGWKEQPWAWRGGQQGRGSGSAAGGSCQMRHRAAGCCLIPGRQNGSLCPGGRAGLAWEGRRGTLCSQAAAPRVRDELIDVAVLGRAWDVGSLSWQMLGAGQR